MLVPLIINKYVYVGKLRIHVQILGKGPAIVLFHPSPHSSAMLLPLAKELATHYTAICVDTPGYGLSDPLPKPPESIEDYTQVFDDLFKKLNIKKFALYGSATGAQIAIRYALNYPDKVSHIFLDNAAHFDDHLRKEILKHYFPDLKPKMDGRHLQVLWNMVSNISQYFPWCFQTEEYKLNTPKLPKEILHHITMDFLKAGENYHYAYKAAFDHENARNVQQLKVHTTIFRWEGSIILKYIDTLLSFNFPEHIQSVSTSENALRRRKEMADFINKKASENTNYIVPKDVGIIADVKNDIRSSFEKPEQTPPEINEDGSYLLNAWSEIKKQNTNLKPKEIQSNIIEWYT